MNKIIEALAYAITIGYFRAYFEAKAAMAHPEGEEPTDEDFARAARFRAAAQRLRADRPIGGPQLQDPPSSG